MEKQIDVTVQSATGAEAYQWVHWLICDNGMTFGAGTALFDPKTGHCAWKEERPPAEYEGPVRLAIARAVRMNGITERRKKKSL